MQITGAWQMTDGKVARVEIVSVTPGRKAFKDGEEMEYLAQLNGEPAESWYVLYMQNKTEYQPFWLVGDVIKITCLSADREEKVDDLRRLVEHVNQALPDSGLPI
jgi:hypothetical protein